MPSRRHNNDIGVMSPDTSLNTNQIGATSPEQTINDESSMTVSPKDGADSPEGQKKRKKKAKQERKHSADDISHENAMLRKQLETSDREQAAYKLSMIEKLKNINGILSTIANDTQRIAKKLSHDANDIVNLAREQSQMVSHLRSFMRTQTQVIDEQRDTTETLNTGWERLLGASDAAWVEHMKNSDAFWRQRVAQLEEELARRPVPGS